jgi:hypothetical protein
VASSMTMICAALTTISSVHGCLRPDLSGCAGALLLARCSAGPPTRFGLRNPCMS